MIRGVPPKIKMNSGLIESEAWKTVNPVEIVGKSMHAVFALQGRQTKTIDNKEENRYFADLFCRGVNKAVT
jgi:hypothetical protein